MSDSLQSNKEITTVLKNISELSSRQMLTVDEKRMFCDLLGDISLRSSTGSEELRETLTTCTKHIFKNGGNDEDIVDLFYTAIKKSNLSLNDMMKDILSYDDFSSTDSAKIVYVKNNYSDSAYVRFSKVFKNPKVAYRSSFEEICEDVYNAVGDYCILPIENSNGGKLFSFYSLIDKYELKIFAVCDIYEANSEHSTRYALLSRKNIAHSETKNSSYFEFSIISDSGYEPSDILLAAKKCSLRLFRIDTTRVPYDDSKFEFYHVFEAHGNSAIPFIMYLDFKYPQHKNIGYYISL